MYRLRCFKYKFGLLQLLHGHFINMIFYTVAPDILHGACLIAENIIGNNPCHFAALR